MDTYPDFYNNSTNKLIHSILIKKEIIMNANDFETENSPYAEVATWVAAITVAVLPLISVFAGH